jgi:uncharacterized protein (DUF433 family)
MTVITSPPPVVAALITVDAQGVARLAGSRIKVAHLVIEHTRGGLTPEQVVGLHPHLSLAQVEAALSYYYAHRKAVEAQIAASDELADQMRAEARDSPVAAHLRAEGLLPLS